MWEPEYEFEKFNRERRDYMPRCTRCGGDMKQEECPWFMRMFSWCPLCDQPTKTENEIVK